MLINRILTNALLPNPPRLRHLLQYTSRPLPTPTHPRSTLPLIILLRELHGRPANRRLTTLFRGTSVGLTAVY